MEDNIFDVSGKYPQSKKMKLTQDKPTQKSTRNLNKEISTPVINEMLEKMREMKQDLDQQLSDVYEKGKESKVNASLLVENSNYLTKEQLKQIEEQEKTLMAKISAAIPPESCLKKKPKSKEKLSQERQGKMRGARNNWIPVR